MKFPSTWTSAELEVADAYGDTLSSLRMNSKPIINTLTELANGYSKEHPKVIVHVIEERIKEVSAELKLTVLYLMDSIVKNHSDPYKKLFAGNVVPTFAHVFKYSEEKARAALFKLRGTWNDIFSSATLIELDRAVNKLDPAWPIAKPKVSPVVSHPTNIHINPAVFGRPSNEVDILSAEVKRKEVELMELRKKQLEMEMEAIKKKIEKQKEEALPGPQVEPVATVQESKPKILVNAKKVKDPRIRGTLPKQIADMLDKESSAATATTAKISTESSRSKTPERSNMVAAEKSQKSKTLTPPSPGQPESPTSTSNLPEEKKVAPPPPTIRDELKKSPTKVSSSSKKSESRSHNTSSSSSGSSKSRKRDREESGSSHSHRDKSSRSNKRDDHTDKSPARKRDKENEEVPMTSSAAAKSSPRPTTPPKVVTSPKQQPEPEKSMPIVSSSPSPSPPSQIRQKSPVSKVVSPPKLTNTRSRKVDQQKFRIPKKLSNKSRSPSPNSFKEEGPHIEFNNGRPIPKKRKDKDLHKRTDKKLKLTTDLFGDETPVGPKSHPAQAYSWAKFKEVNPDEYRTPIKQPQIFGDMQQYQRPDAPREPLWRGQAPGGQWRDQKDPRIQPLPLRNDPRQVRGGMPPMNSSGGFGGRLNYAGSRFPSPFEVFGQPHDSQQPNAISDGLGHFFERLGSTDPEVVLNQVIPVIIRQAQDNLNSGRLNPNQFSSLMKQVMQLKEQAMMLQADKIHHVQTGGSGARKGSNMPWGGPGKQQPLPFNPVDGGIPAMPPPPPPVALFVPPGGVKPRSMSPEAPPIAVANRDLPFANKDDLDMIAADPVSTIDIDLQPRDIRFFGEMATVVMAPGDVRELSFTAGGLDPTRRIIIDDMLKVRVPVSAPNYTPFMLNGMEHRVKLGAPTRELWIDDKWYQCYFNNEIRVQIGPNYHKFFLEGPPPNVTIGKVSLKNLCLGTVQLIIDGDLDYPITIYLDLKPQCVDIAGKPHVFRFVQGLKTLLINGHPFMTQFGGTPMVVYVNQERHYLRLTSLPEGVRPDRMRLMNLEALKGSSSPSQAHQDFGPGSPPMASNDNSQDGMDSGGLNNSFENKAFDRILSMLPSSSTPRQDKVASRRLTSQYSSSPSFEGAITSGSKVSAKPEPAEIPSSADKTVHPSSEAPAVDIHNLWSQLLGAGLIAGSSAAIPGLDNATATPAGSSSSTTPSTAVKSEKEVEKADSKKLPVSKPVEPVEVVKPVVLKSHDKSLKTRQSALINVLYNPSALQCKNCGLRYSPTDMIAYSQHLDWHFRMKRREKENARKAQSRTWYFERMDWINSDEIVDGDKDFPEENDTAKEDDKEEIPVVPVTSDKENKTCPICHEDFEEFYTEDNNPEKDDGGLWYYRNAVVSDSRNYHPQCLQDKTLNEGLEMSAASEDDSHINSISNFETSTEEVPNAMDTTEHDATVKSEDVETKKEPLSPQRAEEPSSSSPVIVTIKPEPVEAEEEKADDSTVVASLTETDHPVKTESVEQEEVVVKTEPETDVEMKAVEATVAEGGEEPKTETEDEPKQEVEGEEPKPETESEDKENSSTNLERSLDGNVLSDAFVAPSKLTSASIRINLTSSIESGKTLERRESIVSNSSDVESGTNPSENSEMDSEGIIQPPKFEAAEPKPKLAGRKLVEMPPQMKGTDISGLCCIM